MSNKCKSSEAHTDQQSKALLHRVKARSTDIPKPLINIKVTFSSYGDVLKRSWKQKTLQYTINM